MKILYVTTISNTVNLFLIPHIKILIDQGHQVDVAFNIEQEVKPEIYSMGCKVHKLPLERSPLKRDNFRAYKMIKNIISSEGYDLVHTHTPVASAIVRLACRNLNNVRVFYTAHGFHFFKGASLKNWLIYYPVEKWLSKYTDTLITINEEDYKRARNHFKAKRIDYVPGVGLDTKKFEKIDIDKSEKRKELGIPQEAFVVLSVGELNKNKNHETVIRAIAKLNNPNIYYVICGVGLLKEYLKSLSKKLGVERRVLLLGFRTDVAEICKASDIFAFPSYREGLPRSIMEGMASGLPCIASNIRGNTDLIENGKGGFLCKPDDQGEFAKAIEKLVNDEKLRKDISSVNLEVIKNFSEKVVNNRMNEIY